MFCRIRGQGSTEYLVLLAVVLIIGLVSIALLSFYPGSASQSQMTQSEMYWKSASPIAILDWSVSVSSANPTETTNVPYFRIMNNGPNPIRITKVFSRGHSIVRFWGGNPGCNPPVRGTYNISDYFYLYPGEEKYFGYIFSNYGLGTVCDYQLLWPTARTVSYCPRVEPGSYAGADPGYFIVEDFGFEYIAYVNGNEIRKRQVGKPVVIKCITARVR